MSVNPPCGMIAVTDPLNVVPVMEVRAAGLYHIAEPSANGAAAATPPRPIEQVPSSLIANPWAARVTGAAANTKSAYQANRRICRISGVGMGRWWNRLAYGTIGPNPCQTDASASDRPLSGDIRNRPDARRERPWPRQSDR